MTGFVVLDTDVVFIQFPSDYAASMEEALTGKFCCSTDEGR
jgi:hypothetical protein